MSVIVIEKIANGFQVYDEAGEFVPLRSETLEEAYDDAENIMEVLGGDVEIKQRNFIENQNKASIDLVEPFVHVQMFYTDPIEVEYRVTASNGYDRVFASIGMAMLEGADIAKTLGVDHVKYVV